MNTVHLTLGIFALLTAATSAGDPVKVGRTGDGRSVVSSTIPLAEEEGSLNASFDFGDTKGFLGPSSNAGDQAGFSNADKTIVAVNHQPATKTSYVHLFLRSPASGDLIFINQVNARLSRLLKGRWADTAESFLRIESITGRKIRFQTVDFANANRESFEFTATVSPEGTFSLVEWPAEPADPHSPRPARRSR